AVYIENPRKREDQIRPLLPGHTCSGKLRFNYCCSHLNLPMTCLKWSRPETIQASSSVSMSMVKKPLGSGRGGCRYVGSDHFLRIDNTIEFSLGHVPELQRRGLQREIVVHRVMRNLGGFVITNHRRKRRDQHERLFDILIDLLQIGLGSFHQELSEIRARIC